MIGPGDVGLTMVDGLYTIEACPEADEFECRLVIFG